MSKLLSSKIADFLLQKNMIKEEEWDIYQYGYDTLIYSIGQTVVLIILGILIRRFIPTMIFIIVFSNIRKYAGGYHASTRIGCTLMTILIWLVAVTLNRKIVMNECFIYFMVILLVIYFALLYLLAPVENINKPLSQLQKKEYKNKAIVISGMYAIVAFIMHFCLKEISSMIIFSMVSVMVLMIIKNKEEGTQDETISEFDCENW